MNTANKLQAEQNFNGNPDGLITEVVFTRGGLFLSQTPVDLLEFKLADVVDVRDTVALQLTGAHTYQLQYKKDHDVRGTNDYELFGEKLPRYLGSTVLKTHVGYGELNERHVDNYLACLGNLMTPLAVEQMHEIRTRVHEEAVDLEIAEKVAKYHASRKPKVITGFEFNPILKEISCERKNVVILHIDHEVEIPKKIKEEIRSHRAPVLPMHYSSGSGSSRLERNSSYIHHLFEAVNGNDDKYETERRCTGETALYYLFSYSGGRTESNDTLSISHNDRFEARNVRNYIACYGEYMTKEALEQAFKIESQLSQGIGEATSKLLLERERAGDKIARG